MGHLDRETLERVHAAALQLRLDRDALLLGVPAAFSAELKQYSAPASQMLSDLHQLNDVGQLRDGSAPLGLWLRNACVLSSARVEGIVFEAALRQLEVGELRSQLHLVGARMDQISELVAKLFLTTMSKEMFKNLEKLADSNGFGPYEMKKGFERELYHLRDIGYVRVQSIGAIPKKGKNLSEYVNVTDPGKDFVRLRRLALGKL